MFLLFLFGHLHSTATTTDSNVVGLVYVLYLLFVVGDSLYFCVAYTRIEIFVYTKVVFSQSVQLHCKVSKIQMIQHMYVKYGITFLSKLWESSFFLAFTCSFALYLVVC